jgi:hypothetical protein
MQTYTHIICFSALLGLCDFATARQLFEDACIVAPNFIIETR